MSLTPDLHTSAEKDLDEIGDYFDERSERVSRRFFERFWMTVRKLADSPELGELCPFCQQESEGLRVWQVSRFPNYLIFYRVQNETLQILRVLHGARNYTEEFDEK